VRLTRRRLLAAAAAIPVALAAERGAHLASGGIRVTVNALRPPARGTSATRCALCGSTDHTMLDPRCPAARPVL
jgi:hypothetical protein